jgi:hypothetical protein
MKPISSVLQFAFGCRHRHRSAVFTIKKRTYQVCLKCGREFDYSWALMHVVRSNVFHRPDASLSRTRTAEAPMNRSNPGIGDAA